ncbi:MAG: polysaccharide biosynthesis/export family protein [Chryseolinea sp.]
MRYSIAASPANFRLITLFALVLSLSACNKQNLVYFSDMPQTAEQNSPIKNYVAPKIQPDDILSISVSSLSAESNVLFNNVLLPLQGNTNVIADKINQGYIVDKNGFINFPVIGKIALAGLSKEDAQDKMTDLIKAHVKNPIVNVRYINFKVTVIGEVMKPASFSVISEKINVLEALGLAGDMTPYGRRETVLVIREKGGVRTTSRLDLTQKEVLNSPFYYLQQNDIVYVEPDNKVKTANLAPGNRFLGIWAAIITSVSFAAITLINRK